MGHGELGSSDVEGARLHLLRRGQTMIINQAKACRGTPAEAVMVAILVTLPIYKLVLCVFQLDEGIVHDLCMTSQSPTRH